MSLVALSPASALTKPQVFNLLEIGSPTRNLGPGNSFKGNGPPSLGNRFAFTNTLYKWAGRKRGARVGRIDAYCTVTNVNYTARSATVACIGTFFLPAGQLQAQTTVIFSENSGPVNYITILGGTGAYAGVRGCIKSTSLGRSDNSNDEFHLLP